MLLIIGIFTGLSLFCALLYLADFSALRAWLRAWLRTGKWGNKDAKERYIEQARHRKDLDEILRGRWF